MKLIMAVSKEGYVARTAEDDMSWTGATDKAVFRLLTSVGGDLGVSRRTAKLMPPDLPGRRIHVLSTKRQEGETWTRDLNWFNFQYPDGWLIGGHLIAMNALMADLVGEAFICVSDRMCFPRNDGEMCLLGTVINTNAAVPRWIMQKPIKIGDTTVHISKRDWKVP